MTLDRRRALAVATIASVGASLPRPALAADPSADEPGLPEDYVGYVGIQRYFPETQHNVDGAFLAFFRAGGQVNVLGYPLTEEFWEPGDAGGAGRMVQYFQRARLEYDLDTRRVRRTPLGEALEKQQPPVPPAPGIRYFPETGHNVGGGFLRFFVENGGAPALGYPISEEVVENGHTAQWFQYVRLEWWPENPPGRQVVYGLTGAEHLDAVRESVPEAALRPARPLAPLREWRMPPPPAPPARRVPPLRIPILYYHQVPSPGPLRDQVQAFKEAGLTIVTLAQAVAAVRGEGSLPDAPLVLTFDDGWTTQFANAAPVLRAEGAPATFFVITRFLGRVAGYMTWEQVRALKEQGHEVESHTQNHPDLVNLRARNEGAAVAEVWESLAELESRLGRSRRLFAYPNGRWDARIAALAARLYRGAVATGGGAAQSQDILYALRRIKAEPSYSPESLLRQILPPA